MKFKNASDAIDALGLLPLEGEGGYFSVQHRDEFGNAIYFMVTPEQFSGWHKLKERETWVFLDGAPLELLTKYQSETHQSTTLSFADVHSILPDTWMAARTTGNFSLVLCFLAPAFSNMELLDKSKLEEWRASDPQIPELIHE